MAKNLIKAIEVTLIILKRAIDNLLSLSNAVDIYNLDLLLSHIAIWHILIGKEVVFQTVYHTLWQL